ncbi:MAG: ParA family protein [Verrucomicrobiae bacterium]|nr:ParA family protein [Verrucomicrobiae bacterium]
MIVGVLNSKGGVGKTTIAVHLAVWLMEQGYATAFVDSDAQKSSTEWIAGLDTAIPVTSVLSSKELIDELRAQDKAADFVVVDGPAGLSEITRTIMLYADVILFPCGPSALDLRAAFAAIKKLGEAQTLRSKNPARVYFVPNKVQKNQRLSRELLNVSEDLGLGLAGWLGLRQAFADAAGQGTVVWKMGRRAEKATFEITKLFKEVFYGTK